MKTTLVTLSFNLVSKASYSAVIIHAMIKLLITIYYCKVFFFCLFVLFGKTGMKLAMVGNTGRIKTGKPRTHFVECIGLRPYHSMCQSLHTNQSTHTQCLWPPAGRIFMYPLFTVYTCVCQ